MRERLQKLIEDYRERLRGIDFKAHLRRLAHDYGVPALLVLVSGTMMLVWMEVRRLGQQEMAVLAAKERIERDRRTIQETRQAVQSIQDRLQANDVPDRLERIETSVKQNFANAVRQNQDSIEKLDAKQRKMVESLHVILDVPKEAIDGTPEIVPGPKVEVEP
jgi:uridine kinase